MNLRRWNQYTTAGVPKNMTKNTMLSGENQSAKIDDSPAQARYRPKGMPHSPARWYMLVLGFSIQTAKLGIFLEMCCLHPKKSANAIMDCPMGMFFLPESLVFSQLDGGIQTNVVHLQPQCVS